MTRTTQTQIARGVAAFAATLAVMIGLPSALVRYVGSPVPATWLTIPSIDDVRLVFRSELSPRVAIEIVAVVVWVLWAIFVGYVVSEAIALARGRTVRRSRILPGFQHTAARLVATTALIITSFGPVRPATAGTIEASAVTLPEPGTDQRSVSPSELRRPEASQVSLPAYTTRPRDTFWSIAEAALGDGLRWREIRDLNRDRPTAHGQPITDSTLQVAAGTKLLLPPDATTADDTVPKEWEYTVVKGDNFWTIAEKALLSVTGEQPSLSEIHTYWKVLIDANTDRLRNPDDPDNILPGQALVLTEPEPIPQDELPLAPDPPSEDAAPQEIIVQEGDSFWTLSRMTLTETWGRTPTRPEVRTYAQAMIHLNLDRLPEPGNPDLIKPGQALQRPPVVPETTVDPAGQLQRPADDGLPDPEAQPRPTPRTVQEPPRSPATTTPTSPPSTDSTTGSTPYAPKTQDPAEAETPTDLETEDEQFIPIVGWSAGLGILAAGIVALLTRLRRMQLRQRGTLVPAGPSPGASAVEATFRNAAASNATEFVDLALRAMASQLDREPPRIVGLEISDADLNLRLAEPDRNPPHGWHTDTTGTVWTTPTTDDVSDLRASAEGIPNPYPTLITVGHSPEGQLLIDLEHAGAIQIEGSAEEVTAACYTIAAELAVTRFAYFLQVMCVGFGDTLAGLDRIQTVASIDDILWLIQDTSQHSPESEEDESSPVIVIDPASSPPASSGRLFAAVAEQRPVIALVGYPTVTPWRLRLNAGTITLEPHGASISRRDLSATEQSGLAELLAATQGFVDPPPPTVTPTPDEGRPAQPPDVAPSDTDSNDVPRMELKVLGHVCIPGASGFRLTRSTELIAYLALHRSGVDAYTLMEAIWPNEPADRLRLNRHMSLTRTALGRNPDGGLYLPHLEDNLYRVTDHLTCDLDEFERLLTKSRERGLGDAERMALLSDALHLVDNAPFTGVTKGYTWAYTEGIVTRATLAVDDAAHTLAAMALENGDYQLVTWASRKGLLAISGCEECYRTMMRSAAEQGHRAAVVTLYKELERVTYSDDGPDETGWLDPETDALYAQLTSGAESARRR